MADIRGLLIGVGLDSKAFTDGLSKAQKDLQGFAATASVAGFRLGAAFSATFGVIGGLALKFGSDFELAFAGVKKTVEGTPEQFKELEQTILDTSVATGIAATELADLARIGGQLGIEPENLAEFTDVISKLSIAAAELPAEEAARGLARIAAISGEGTDAIGKMANVLAFLGDEMPTTESRILDFTGRIAGFSKAVGLSSEEMLGLSAGFSAIVGGTERAASAVERFLAEMTKAVAQGGASLDAFATTAGISSDAFAEKFASKPIEAIGLVMDGLGELSNEGMATLLQRFDELGIKGVRMLSTFAAAAGASDKLKQAMQAAALEAERQTKLNKEFAIQMDTVAKQFGRVKEGVKLAGIELFKSFREPIMQILTVVNDRMVPALSTLAQQFNKLPNAAKIAALGMLAMIPAFAGLLVVIGQVGGGIVSLTTLLAKAAGPAKNFFSILKTGTPAVTTAANSVGQMSLPLTAASSKMGLFAKTVTTTIGKLAGLGPILAVAAKALAVFAAAFLSTLAVMDIFEDRAVEIGATQRDFIQEGISNAGFFAKAWQGAVEIVKLSFNVLKQGIVELGENFGLIGIAIRDKFGQAMSFLGTVIDGVVAQLMTIPAVAATVSFLGDVVDGISDAWDGFKETAISAFDAVVTRIADAQEGLSQFFFELIKQTEDFGNVTGEIDDELLNAAAGFGVVVEAGDNWKSVMAKISEAQRKMADESQNGKEALERQAAALKESQISADAMVRGMLAAAEEAKDLKDVAKGLGVDIDTLTAAMEGNEEVFLASAKAQLADKKAREEWAKAVDSQRAALDALTIDAATDQLRAMEEALEANKQSASDFTEEGLNKITSEMVKLSQVTGQELTPRARELLSAWVDNKKASLDTDKAFRQLLETMEKMRTPLDDLIKMDNFDPFGGGDMEVPEGVFDGVPELMQKVFDQQNIKNIEEELKLVKAETKEWNEALKATSNIMDILGLDADSSFAKIIGGFTIAAQAGSKFKEEMTQAKLELAKIKSEGGGFGDFLSEGGVGAGIQLGQSLLQGAMGVWEAGSEGGLRGALGGAIAGGKLGSDIGGMFGPIGSTAGAIMGAAIGASLSLLRGKPEFKKIAEDIGRDFGVEISDELAKQIEATADELDLGRFEARLLHLGDIITEVGGIGEFGFENTITAVNDLMNAIAMGAVPAAEGIEELGTVFGQMADEMFEAGTIADAAMLQVIDRAKQLGLEVPEIAAFISDQLAQAAAGISQIIGKAFEDEETGETLFGGIQVASVEDAQAQASIFAAGFFATLKEKGLKAAVDAFGPAFAEMKEKFAEFGGDINFGGVQKFFDIAQDPKFGPLLEGVQGLKDGMTGLANAGFLTADTFGAFQQQGQAAFEQLQALGLEGPEALQQMAPFLQEAINASQTFGFELDENTKAMIEQAEAAGIGFATDPMTQMVDVLALIAEQLGVTQEALSGVGVGAEAAGTAIDDALGGDSMEDRKAGLDDLKNSSDEALNGIAEGAKAAGDAIGNSIGDGAQEAAAAGVEAAEGVGEKWAEATAKLGEGFEEQTTKIQGDYAMVDEATVTTGEGVSQLGDMAISAASGFDQMALAAQAAATAASSALNAGSGGAGPGTQAGQFGLTKTVSEPTTFIAGEAGEETVTIDPGGDAGAPQGGGGVVVLQIDGKTIGKVLGDLSRTGDVRIHPSAVKDFG